LRRPGDEFVNTAITGENRDFIALVASELACGVDKAVECWMAQVEQALFDPSLTSLGRLTAAREVILRYKHLTGKERLECTRWDTAIR